MRRFIPLTLVGLMCFTACAHRPSATTADGSAPAAAPSSEAGNSVDHAPAMKELQSFHLNDPEAPQVVDEEFANIPTEVNPAVDKWISYFQGKGHDHMERYLARSSRYEKLMKKVLRENGVPEDLFYVALIESGFTSSAISNASAVGYWQFIRGTGKRYGLEISKLVDERRDPVYATQAAAEYFKGLYSVFGSWYLAMASYNVGENRVKREVSKYQTRDFWELSRKSRLPRETLSYVPKFIAAKLIAKDPAKYGFGDVDFLPPIEFDTVTLEKPVNLRVLSEKLSYNYEDFKALNPKFKGEVAPLQGTRLDLRIPVGQRAAAIQAASESVAESVEYVADIDTQTYKIRRGDNLSSVARRFHTSVAYLRDLNDMPRKKHLRVGSVIYVPDRTPLRERERTVKTRIVSPKSVAGGEIAKDAAKFHVVQSGDNLSNIAKRYGTTITELARLNNLTHGKLLKVGMKLKLPSGEPEAAPNKTDDDNSKSAAVPAHSGQRRTLIHVVKTGENLSTIAELYKVSLSVLKKKNHIRQPASLMAGAKLVIPSAHAEE